MRKVELVALAMAMGLAVGATSLRADENQYNWSGLYVGGHAGFGQASSNISATPNGNFVTGGAGAIELGGIIAANGAETITKSGALAGLHAGYDHKFGSVIVGIVGGISYYGLNSARVRGPFTSSFGTDTFIHENTNVTTVADLRLRLGTVVAPRTMVYITGGIATGRRSFDESVRFVTGTTLANNTYAASFSGSKTGATFGAGVEYAIAKNWTLGAEYLHTDLGTVWANGSNPSGTAGIAYSERLRLDAVKLLLNYKFN